MPFTKLLLTLSISALLLYPSALLADDREAMARQFDQTFNEMIRNPSDMAKARQYSDLAAQMGNYEAAIPPLERMLLIDPDQPDVKLAIGSYYIKLGSKDMAKVYLEDAKKTPGAKPEVIQQADSLIKQL